ncbi:hypothetical protein JOD54_004840 [Actinokineospora baliensis]|uniref:DUF3995 domain-containing protein n=1 Tax=Actinokineospora baliensis TaxID=547056 RepID=UPI00195DCC0B|nr:DUF3995 domain-containing protein [Actinokineospora baliensis]MBM7774636.1 hypothetical protein [Actinokineospora baliensis]
MTSIIAIVLALSLTVVGVLHLSWAAGVYFPFASEREAARKTMGDHEALPPWPLTTLVGALLVLAAYLVLALHWPTLRIVADWVYEWSIWGIAVVFFLRALEPLAQRTANADYNRLNRRLYSPFVLALSALAAVVALA